MIDSHAITDRTSLRGVLALTRNTSVTISLPGLSARETDELQGEMSDLLAECGYGVSAGCLVAGIAASIAVDATRWRLFAIHPIRTILLSLAACLLAAGAGKAAGQLRARWKLGRLVRSLEVLAEVRPNSPVRLCGLQSRTIWDA